MSLEARLAPCRPTFSARLRGEGLDRCTHWHGEFSFFQIVYSNP